MFFYLDYWILLLSIGLFLIAIWLLTSSYLGKKKKDLIWKNKVKVKLQNLQNSPTDLTGKIIQLDKLLEYALQNRFQNKTNLGKLLQKNFKKFTKQELNNLWKAHKIRNSLVHDIDANFNQTQLLEAERIFLNYLTGISQPN